MNHSSLLIISILVLFSFEVLAQQSAVIELKRDGKTVQTIPLDESQPVTIQADGSGLIATPEPGFVCGSCDGVQVSMADVDGGSFSISSASVTQGSSVRLSWSSRGAWACEGSGLPGTTWSGGGKLPSGDENVVLDLEPNQQYEASIICTNGAGNTATRGPLAIEVRPSITQVPEECRSRPRPAMAQAVQCKVGSANADCRLYENVYETAFPGTGRAQQIFTNRDEYIAMEFTMPSYPATANGSWSFVSPQVPPSTTGPVLRTISRCPGEFDRDTIAAEMGSSSCFHSQISETGFGGLSWVMAGSGGSGCPLTPGQTYYFNVLYTNSPAATAPADLNWQCGIDPSISICSSNTSARASGL